MANEVFNLEGKVTVNYSAAQEGLNKISEAAEDVADDLESIDDAADEASEAIEDSGDSADKANDSFDTWGVTLANIAAQAMTQLIDKCVELAQSIVDTGIETEYAFAQLETIAGAENVDALTESIMELSSETGIAASELATTAYNAISAGASAEEAADMVEAACKLATAGFTDTDSALSVLSTAMNAYGDEAGTVAEISDSLIQVQNLGVTTVEQLASSMGKAIATGSAYDVSLGNLEAAYVSLTKAGISTEESTTYLNSMLSELGDSSSDVAAVLETETGKSFTELMNDGYSLSDVLGIIYESLDEDTTAMMNLWSSQEAGKASNAIINQGLSEFNENLEQITTSSGATEDAYSTMTETMSTKTAIMETSFQNLGLSIYEKAEPAISSIVGWITDSLVPGIEGLIDDLDVILPVISGVAAGFVALKASMAISEIITTVSAAWKAYQTANEGVTVAQQLLNAAMNANPITLIVTLIAGLVAAVIVLWNTNEDFRNSVIEIWEKIESVFSDAVEAIQSGLEAAWEYITNAIEIAIEAFTELLEKVSETVGSIVSTVTEKFNSIKSTITNALNTIKEIFNSTWDGIKSYVTSTLTSIKTSIISPIEATYSTVSGTLSNIKTKFTGTFENVKSTVSAAIEKIKSYLDFEWSLPSLKLPHISISGSFSLNPISVPSFSISWYKKAMDEGMIMDSPTIFGFDAGSQSFLGGGEAGSETVVGTESLMYMVQAAVSEQNEGLTDAVYSLISLVDEKFTAVLENMGYDIVTDDGAILAYYTPLIDKELGTLVKKKR